MLDAAYIKFAEYLLEESAKIILPYYRKPLKVEKKSDLSPVTIADKNTEEHLRKLIQKHFPNHGILGEEFGLEPGNSEYQWMLDPIDGTKSFIHGTPLFGTLIALVHRNTPVLGAIGFPVLKEMIIGDGETTLLNDVPVHMRNCQNLGESLLLTSDQKHIQVHKDIDAFNILLEKVGMYRTWGDCYGYYLLASGYADIMIDPVMSVWDSMAIIPIIRGAGGIVTDYQGGEATKGQDLIASNPVLHPLVISLLNPSNAT